MHVYVAIYFIYSKLDDFSRNCLHGELSEIFKYCQINPICIKRPTAPPSREFACSCGSDSRE